MSNLACDLPEKILESTAFTYLVSLTKPVEAITAEMDEEMSQ
jgi:hypothetical protein